MATGVAARCLRDLRCRQCTGKQLSRAIWSSFNKERMSHLCDSTVAGPTARRDNVLASNANTPLSVTPLLNVPYKGLLGQGCQKPLALVQHGFAPVQKRVLVVQKTLGRPFLPWVQNTFCIRTESPRKGTRKGFRCFYRKPSLKPSWIHLTHKYRLRELGSYIWAIKPRPLKP